MGTEAFVADRSRQFLYQRFNRLLAEAAHLVETDLPPAEFYRELLQRVLAGTGAVAAAVWTRTASGAIQAEYQVNGSSVSPDGAEHDELLHQVFHAGHALALEPRTGSNGQVGPAASNPTAYLLLIAPIRVERQAAALIEARLEPIQDGNLQAALLHFLAGLAHHASLFVRDDRLREAGRTTADLDPAGSILPAGTHRFGPRADGVHGGQRRTPPRGMRSPQRDWAAWPPGGRGCR